MSGTLRTITDWTLPPAVKQVLKNKLRAASVVRAPANAALRGRHQGERRCFVIGNGPSLGRMDLTALAGEVTIAINSFYNHPQAQVVNPHYLCVADPHFFADTPANLAWHRQLSATSPRAVVVLNADARPLVERHGLYKGHQTFFVPLEPARSDAPAPVADLATPNSNGTTTGTLLAIPLALYLGFSSVYLVGFDANWMEDVTASYHFYKSHDLYPEFDSVMADNRGFKYEDHLVGALEEFRAHRRWKDHAAACGQQIINAGHGGVLDAYPRVPFASLFDHEARHAAGPVRLNLGCGGRPLEGYINVDEDSLDQLKARYPANPFPADCQVLNLDVFNLPYANGTVEEVRADSFIEHLGFADEPRLLREIHRVLRPGGTFCFSVPDFEEVCRLWLAAQDDWRAFYRTDPAAIATQHWFGQGSYSMESRWGYLTAIIYGSQNGEGQYHRNCYSEAKLRQMLPAAGFVVDEISRFRWKQDRDPMLQVTARRQQEAGET